MQTQIEKSKMLNVPGNCRFENRVDYNHHLQNLAQYLLVRRCPYSAGEANIERLTFFWPCIIL